MTGSFVRDLRMVLPDLRDSNANSGDKEENLCKPADHF
jgi:hypothetical protein